MSQILRLSPRLINSLREDEKVVKTLRIYGYNSPSDFFESLTSLLNEQYNFLHITEVQPFDDDENSIYHMYNGYVEGDFDEYDEVNVSLTTMKDGKLGNVFITQQIIPMITAKLENDINFLLSKRIKNICVLTTHISSVSSPEANAFSSRDNTAQMVINILNTIGYDILALFDISNSNLSGRYYSIEEFIDHSSYINSLKPSNIHFNHVSFSNGLYVVDFAPNEKVQGQTIKFLLVKALAAIHLSDGVFVDVSSMLFKSNDAKNVLAVMNYSEHIFSQVSIKHEVPLELDENTSLEENIEVEELDISTYEEHLRHPIFTFNSKGKKVYKTSRDIKVKSLENHSYNCACHTDSHYYFTSHSTNQQYVEGHHMIPMEYQGEFWRDMKVNLDSSINIIPLCPHCHQKIHKALKMQRLDTIKEVYDKYNSYLQILDGSIDLVKFAALYNVYVY